MQRTVTAADALVDTEENLYSTLTNAAPSSDATQRAIDNIMQICKSKVVDEQTPTDAQRVCKEVANTQKVANEAAHDNTKSQGAAATGDLTANEQSTGVASCNDINLSMCGPVGANTDNGDGMRMTGIQVTYLNNTSSHVVLSLVTQELPPSQNTR